MIKQETFLSFYVTWYANVLFFLLAILLVYCKIAKMSNKYWNSLWQQLAGKNIQGKYKEEEEEEEEEGKNNIICDSR